MSEVVDSEYLSNYKLSKDKCIHNVIKKQTSLLAIEIT
jgi:hypothetical protein